MGVMVVLCIVHSDSVRDMYGKMITASSKPRKSGSLPTAESVLLCSAADCYDGSELNYVLTFPGTFWHYKELYY